VANADIHHDERRYGHTGYTLPKLIRLSFNLLVNYSALPLKAMGWLGMGVSLAAFVVGVTFLVRQNGDRASPRGVDQPGWCWCRSSAG